MRKRIIAALRRPAAARGRGPSPLDGLLFLLFSIPAPWSGRHGAAGIIMAVLVAVPVLGRRRAPVAMFAAAWALAAVQGIVAAPTFSDCALLVTLYTIGSTQPRRTATAAWAALEVGAVLASVKFGTPGLHRLIASFVAMSAMAIAALVIGINVGNRRQILAALRERAERLEAEREQAVALARANERSRIAREMHDVIAHNLSVMVALCDGAAYHVHDAPERTESALHQAARTGRDALAEMRQLLGVLRDPPAPPARAGFGAHASIGPVDPKSTGPTATGLAGAGPGTIGPAGPGTTPGGPGPTATGPAGAGTAPGGPGATATGPAGAGTTPGGPGTTPSGPGTAPTAPALAPQPGVRQIGDLVEQVRSAGLPVTYSLTGQLTAAAPGMELAVYRIVQEALTNTLKHAGPGAAATVSLMCDGDRVTVDVQDTGAARLPANPGGSGLRGMRERAALYGGTLQAGPAPAGGWSVRATLGLPSAVTAPAA